MSCGIRTVTYTQPIFTMTCKHLIMVMVLVLEHTLSTNGQLETLFAPRENEATQSAKRLLDATQAGLKLVTSESLKAVADAANPAVELARESASAAKNVLEDISGMVMARVLEVQQKAQEVGADVSQCIEENQNKSSRIIAEASNSLEECVLAAAKEAMRPMKIISNLTRFALDRFNEGGKEVVNCALRFQPITCLFGTISQAENNIEDLMKEVTREVRDAMDFVGTIGPTAMSCTSKQMQLAQNIIGDVLSSITSCVKLPL